jgi:diaminohydroxyphosphoribosylaminopyrimidine deaminase/5-amino-6-(5-phosphoribosylamino)uracil reductase
MKTDAQWMREAVRLAAKAWGMTSPNPLVGAVVVREGELVGAGWHHRAGTPHAEVHALAAAGERARGATLYVTLEPCSTHGRTPPCTEAVLAAGVGRVVIGSLDPNPAHAGRGVALLRAAGVAVESGIEAARCAGLNESFYCWIRHRRPYVLLKLGMTLDGRIATAGGESQWITGPAARRWVQRYRQWADAILVGGETVRRDNPQLLVRQPASWPRQPLRLVATRSGQLGEAPQVLTDGRAETRLVACADPAAWRQWLAELGARQITALLVEGGGELAGELLRAGCVDKIAFFVAPRILGGRHSRPAIGGADPLHLAEALGVQELTVRRVGADLLIMGYLSDVHRYS